MWGEDPAQSALFARDYFKSRGVESVLIPGIGYGRNAQPFLEAGMAVTGIEISQTAIDLARSQMGLDITIYHGSVSAMPFESNTYDGIFSHALIHLLDGEYREKLIKDCYAQLAPSGTMIVTAVSTKSPSYGRGTELGPNRYEQHGGAQIFFYDEAAIRQEFGAYGLVEVREIMERGGGAKMPFLAAICHKEQGTVENRKGSVHNNARA